MPFNRYQAKNSSTGEVREARAKGPFEVVNFPFRPVPAADIDFDLKHDFNFLSIAQWSPRKNIENTIEESEIPEIDFLKFDE